MAIDKPPVRECCGRTARRRARNGAAKKELVSFDGKDTDIEGEMINDLTNELVNDGKSRDGIPHRLFPPSTKDLPGYRFEIQETSI